MTPRSPAVASALEKLENAEGCRVGLCARVLEGPRAGESVGVGEDLALPSASLIKVLILAELLRQADSGRILLQELILVTDADMVGDSEMLERESLPARVSVQRLAEGMITVSDNAATNLLTGRVGMERVNALARDLGLARTALRRRMMDFGARALGIDNTTSAADMVVLLGEIWRGSFLSSDARAFALDLLLGQRIDSKIPLALPSGARFAHKTGDLEGVENGAGLVLMPDRTVALAVLVRGDVGRAMPAVAPVVTTVCDFLTMPR